MEKNIFILILLFFISSNLLSEEIEPEKVTKDRKQTNWSIQTSLGKGNSEIEMAGGGDPLLTLLLLGGLSGSNSSGLGTILLFSMLGSDSSVYKGESYQNHFKAEYKPKYWGFQFGMSSGSYDLQQEADPFGNAIPLLFFLPAQPVSSSGYNSGQAFATILLLSAFLDMASQTPVSLSLTTFDFAATLHVTPFSLFDPYLVAGIGIGSCGSKCTLGKGFAKLGLRLNLTGGFLFLEGQKQISYLKPAGFDAIEMEETMGLFGFGLYL